MNKKKIISFIAALLAVVALGIFMGNYMFKFMEAKSIQSNSGNSKSNTANSKTEQNKVDILYGDKENPQSTNDSEFKQNQQFASNGTAIPLASQSVNTSSNNNIASNTPPTEENKAKNDALVFSPNGPRWYAFASTNGLNVRENPDKKGKFLFKVSKGTRGVVKEKKDGWTYIQWDFNKKKGWSIDDYLIQGPANIVENVVNKSSTEKTDNKTNTEKVTQASIEKELEQSKTIIAVARPASLTETVITYTNGKELPKNGIISPPNGSSVANIREAPNTQCKKIAKLPKGTTVGIKSVKQVEKHQWFEITFSNNSKTGWTREDNLKF